MCEDVAWKCANAQSRTGVRTQGSRCAHSHKCAFRFKCDKMRMRASVGMQMHRCSHLHECNDADATKSTAAQVCGCKCETAHKCKKGQKLTRKCADPHKCKEATAHRCESARACRYNCAYAQISNGACGCKRAFVRQNRRS